MTTSCQDEMTTINYTKKLSFFLRVIKMMAYLRVKKIEDELLKKISEELNRQRLDLGKNVMKDSEILHDVLIKALEKCRVEEGELIV